MDRQTRKGLRMRMAAPQRAPSRVRRAAATPQHIVTVPDSPDPDAIRSAPSSRFFSRGSTRVILDDRGSIERENRFYPSRSEPIRQAESDSRSAASSARQTGHSWARCTTAFSLHQQGPEGNTLNTNDKPVRISDARAERKKRKQCFKPKRCCGYDLRFSFPRGGRFLHFLFQSARIGLGRSVKEDWMAH
jgi:hypothetical protein